MKKYLKYAIYAVIMTALAIVLNGCMADFYFEISYDCDTSYMENRMVDILVPITEDDIRYREINDLNEFDKIGGDSEIARFNDGYMSLKFHTSMLNEVTNKSDMTRFCFGNKDNYYQFCDTYKSFRVALVDENGNIIQITEEYPLKSSERYYLDYGVSYNPQNNKVNLKYINRDGMNIYLFIALVFVWITPVLSTALFLVVLLCKDTPFYKGKRSVVAFACGIIPLAVYIFLRYIEATKSSVNQQMIWDSFFDFGVSVIAIMYLLLPYAEFIAVSILVAVRRKKTAEIDEMNMNKGDR